MKKVQFFILFILICFAQKEIFAGRKIQWQKYLNDTTIKPLPLTNNWIVQDATTDFDNNVYIASVGSQDTFVSVITKISPDGEKLWQRTVLPVSTDYRLTTCSDTKGKLFIDIDGNLVFIIPGRDTLGVGVNGCNKRFILLSKWTTDGILLDSSFYYLPISTGSGEELRGITIGNNGDIFIAHAYDNYTSMKLSIMRYDKDFNILLETNQNISFAMSEYLESPPVITVKDSFLYLAYSTSGVSTNQIYISQINLNSGSVVWQKSIVESAYWVYPLQLETMDNALYLCSYHLFKLSLVDGAILAEDNFQFRPVNCVFDQSNSKIYSLNNITTEEQDKLIIYDTNLNPIQIIDYFPYWPGKLVLKDTILSVYCYNTSLSHQFYWNRVAVFRISTNGQIIDSLYYTYPEAIWDGGAVNFISDNNNDLVLVNQTQFYMLLDTIGNCWVSSNPIFIQKICYNCFDDLKGRVYFDTIFNCQIDSSEDIVENNFIHLMPEDIYTLTDSNGYYTFMKSNGIANVEYISKFDNSFLCNTSNSYTVDIANGPYDSLDFGLRMKLPFVDAACNLGAGMARPGFQHSTVVNAENLSTSKQYNLHLELILDNKFSFLSASQTPDSIIGNRLVWLIDSMNSGAAKQFIVKSLLPSSANFSNAYTHTSKITLNNDMLISNNFDTTTGVITGSFDPNHKLAYPVGLSRNHYIEYSTPITYYIEFQNTGNDTAFNIRVFDVLDNNLDISSLKIVGASHKMTYKLENRQLKFYFNDIMLVDCNKSYENSIGFVSYSIKPKPSLDGTIITNTADIYFDYNSPIKTNSTYHTIGRIGSYFENTAINDFNLFPNPVLNENVNVTVNLVEGDHYKLIFTDMAGKPIYSISESNLSEGKYTHQLKIANLFAAGIYLVSLETSNKKITKKLILTK